MGEPRISEKCDIGDRQALAHEPGLALDEMLHQIERLLTTLHPHRIAFLFRAAEIDHMEAAGRHIGLVAVLLPEQQFVDLRLGERVGREQ